MNKKIISRTILALYMLFVLLGKTLSNEAQDYFSTPKDEEIVVISNDVETPEISL